MSHIQSPELQCALIFGLSRALGRLNHRVRGEVARSLDPGLGGGFAHLGAAMHRRRGVTRIKSDLTSKWAFDGEQLMNVGSIRRRRDVGWRLCARCPKNRQRVKSECTGHRIWVSGRGSRRFSQHKHGTNPYQEKAYSCCIWGDGDICGTQIGDSISNFGLIAG